MNNKDKWIEEVLESLSGIESARVSEPLNKQILDTLFKQPAIVISIKPQIKWAVAASLLLLLSLNCISIINYNKAKNASNEENTYNMASAYFSYTEQF